MAARNETRTTVLFVGALLMALLATACGGSDDEDDSGSGAAETSTQDTETEETGDGDIAGTVGDDGLLVPRDYLQGAWCDSDGTTITIDGDTANLTDSSGAGIELPLDVLFLDTVDNELLSRGDDEFVISAGGDEVTFVRGAC